MTSLQLDLLMLPRGAQLAALAALTRLKSLALSGSSSKAALAAEHTLALAALTGEWAGAGPAGWWQSAGLACCCACGLQAGG